MSTTIPNVSFKRNKSERLPCVLVVDGSGSMRASGAIGRLQEGLALLERELKQDDDTAYGVQLAVIRMGGDDQVTELTGFTDAADFVAPTVEASGRTPLGMAVAHAMDLIEQQKALYRANGIAYKRPWLWIWSDGVPTDDWQAVAQQAQAAQAAKRFTLWAIGIGNDVDLGVLKCFTNGDRCFSLGQRSLPAMFEFLSASAAAGSKAAAGQQVELPPLPAGVVEV